MPDFRPLLKETSEIHDESKYKGDRIIVERVVGEPVPQKRFGAGLIIIVVGLLTCILSMALVFGWVRFVPSSGEKLTTVKMAGCDLRVVSVYDRYGQDFTSPWQIKNRVLNAGTVSCIVQSEHLDPTGPFTIGAGAIFEREMITEHAPNLVDFEASVGTTNSALTKTRIQLYTGK